MGLAALLTLPVYAASFGWMESLVSALSPNSAGFSAYQLGSHAIALAVMLPATFLAGMTLPLFTFVLLKEGEGEASIGRIYAANTIGAIVGVVFAVHVGLPYLGLRNLVVFGVLIDVVLGIYLLARAARKVKTRQPFIAAAVGLGAIVLVLFRFELDQSLLASGVFRTGDLASTRHEMVRFYADGKTSTVTLRQLGDDYLTLATNGKPEAGIYLGEEDKFTIDEVTMALAGAIGLAYKPDARTAGIIGLGAGITTHTLLLDKDMERVDTVEIEPEVIRAARGFGSHVERVFNDPRSHLEIEDAKTFFSLNNRQYDLIITEPSNPWVSGVASLFSSEFYRMINNYLSDDGVFIQWIHLYEFDDDLVFSVLKAMAPHFDDFVVYNTTDLDM
jgi:predicted membrane-bound spermidine synthase